MSDNMCEHGGLDGNCLRCKDATITRLEAEIAALRTRAEQAEKELAELQGKRNTAYSYIEDVLIGSPYEWAGKRLLEMIGDKK